MQKEKGSSTLVGIIIIIIAAVILFGGVFAYQYFTTKTNNQPQIQKQTAGWKTYTNTEYGFEINYPQGWFAQENPDDSFFQQSQVVAFSPVSFNEIKKYFDAAKGKGLSEEYSRYFDKFCETIWIYADSADAIPNYNSSSQSCAQKIVVNGVTGCEEKVDKGDNGTYYYVSFPTPDRKSLIEIGSCSSDLNKSFLDQISSTFKFTNQATVNSATGITVAGMQKYTDSNFGFSFWYPSSWVVKPDARSSYISAEEGGTVVKYIMVGPEKDLSNSIVIEEFTSSGMSITDNSAAGPAGNGSKYLKYYFNPNNHTWMGETADMSGVTSTFAANVSTNTMGGLHILGGNARFGDDVIIPLSAKNFLVVSSAEAGTIQERLLANTITATDPSVATTVSATEQMKTIHTEGLLYGTLGTSIPSWGYIDSQYVYDSQGNIVEGANPATFKSINTYSDGFNSPTGFATDETHIYNDYFGGKAVLVEGADPATFVVIRAPYQIFYAPTSGKYGQSFTSYDTTYEKDKSHVWDKGRLVPGVDLKTFVVTGEGQTYGTNYDFSKGVTLAKDANHTYGEDAKGNVTVDGVTVQQ